MASNSTVLNDIDENFLLCSICLEQFKDPKLLPCLHRFCSVCLETLIGKAGEKLICPLCQQTIVVPEDGFKTDFFVNSIVEYVHFKKSLKSEIIKKCFGCTLDLAVTAYCFKCNDFLCQNCRDIHMKNNIVKEHRPHVLELCNVADSNLSMAKLDSLKDAPKCHTHPEKVAELCCKSCHSLPICMVCGAFGEHKAHDLQEVTSLAKSERKLLADSLGILMELKEKVYDMPRVMSEKRTKLEDNTRGQEQVIKSQFEREKMQINREIDKLKNDFKMQKDMQTAILQKDIRDNKKELEEKIQMLVVQHEKVCAEKTRRTDKQIKMFQKANEAEIARLCQQLESLQSLLDEKTKLVKVHQKQSHDNIRELSDYYDNIIKRFQNLTFTASSILTTKHDWTSVQSIPDVIAAIDPLIADTERQFPSFETLGEVIEVDLDAMEAIREGIVEKEMSVIQIEGFNLKFHSIQCIRYCKDAVIVAGKTEGQTHITTLSADGEILFQTFFEKYDLIRSTSACCDVLSEDSIVLVSGPSQIAIYDLFKGTRCTKLMEDVIANYPAERVVLCVAVLPIKKWVVVGTDNRALYVFNSSLQYIRTVILPDTVTYSREIAFRDDNFLICDTMKRRAYAVSVKGCNSRTVYEFTKPREIVDPDCWPCSICVDQNGYIYILWSLVYTCLVVGYQPTDGEQLSSRSVDSDASCITTAVKGGTEKLMLATYNSGKLYEFDLPWKL
ncbi:uncharacterized protein [Apostichopus japonicus]|uniref:uncharacterized protein n=1 Tax=Stichopus japonicus TaxID=307972 RepID=UPI003AB2C923